MHAFANGGGRVCSRVHLRRSAQCVFHVSADSSWLVQQRLKRSYEGHDGSLCASTLILSAGEGTFIRTAQASKLFAKVILRKLCLFNCAYVLLPISRPLQLLSKLVLVRGHWVGSVAVKVPHR